MKRLALLAACGGLLQLGIPGCARQDDEELGKKLDKIEQRLAGIEKQIKEGGGGRGAARGAARPEGARPRRPRGPDPSKVYSVPIDGAATVGPANAKVTMVEAFEFA